jgi:hypothetical protein
MRDTNDPDKVITVPLKDYFHFYVAVQNGELALPATP